MKIKNSAIFFTAACILFAQPVRDDDWVESGRMLRFPSSGYFTAVGIGSSEKSASENAVVEIQRQISSSVRSQQVSREFSLITDKSSVDTSLLSIQNKISVAGDISGVEIIATSVRRNNFYAFAALEKEKFISLRKLKITELQSELIKTYAYADKAIYENKIALAISLLNSANEKVAAIRSERILLSAATVLTENEETPVSKADIDAKLAAMTASVKIIVGAGDKQSVFVGEIPSEPFTVIATANDQPIENLPIALFDEKNRRIAVALSDNDGTAYLFLDEKSPSLVGTYKYKAIIDLPNARNLPPAEFQYSVKTRPTSIWAQISVSVAPDLKNDISLIDRAAKEMLAQHGILDDKCGCYKISVLTRGVQKEKIDGVSAMRSFYRTEVSAQIILSDNGGKQLYSATVRQVGAGNDKASAVSDGIKKIQLRNFLKEIEAAVQNHEHKLTQKTNNSELPEKKKIVVLPFIYRGFGGFGNYSNYEALSTMLTTALVNTRAFTVLERQQLRTAQSDRKFTDPEIQQAKTLGADLVVTGNISKSGETVEADMRIIDVFSSEILSSVSVQGKSVYDFKDLANKLVRKLDIDFPDEIQGGTCCK